MLLHLQDQGIPQEFQFKGVEQGRQILRRELYVHHCTHHLYYLAFGSLRHALLHLHKLLFRMLLRLQGGNAAYDVQ